MNRKTLCLDNFKELELSKKEKKSTFGGNVTDLPPGVVLEKGKNGEPPTLGTGSGIGDDEGDDDPFVRP